MNKIAIIILSLILAMVVGLGACVTAPPPAPPAASSPEAVTVIELPSEAHIGDYMTIKIQVPRWDKLQWPWNEYSLTIWNYTPQRADWISWELGRTRPDDDLMVCWYVQIPTTWEDWSPEGGWHQNPFVPGNYQLKISGVERSGSHPLLERNIIIR